MWNNLVLQVEYLVRWKGYTDKHNSWVCKDQLVHTEPIEEYERSLVKKEEKVDECEKADDCEPIIIIVRQFSFQFLLLLFLWSF